MYDDSLVEYIPPRPGEARETLADISDTCAKINWSPSLKNSLEDYVKAFVHSNQNNKEFII